MPHNANMLGLISKLATPQITVHQERCAIVRNRNADCLKCAKACTSGCISFDGEQLSVSPELCIGCGTCATVCPTCALEAHNPNDAELEGKCLKALEGSGHIRIACSNAIESHGSPNDTEGAIRVECLGRVEESLLTSLAAAKASEVELLHCDCGKCEHIAGWVALQDVCKTEKTLLDAWGGELDVRLVQVQSSPSNEGSSHSEPQRQAKPESEPERASEEANGESLEYAKVMADGTLAHFLPDRRSRLLDSLAAFGQPKNVSLKTRLWGRVEIDPEKCTSCRMCATFCPTGAIAKFDDPDGTFGVEHYPGDCVKCRSCESICFGKALSIHDDVNARDMVDGGIERFEMEPIEVARGEAHTIWHMAQSFMKTDHIYER